MENCPTCNAKLKCSRICRRCRTNLSQALDAAEQAEQHFQSANQAYVDGRFEAMLHHSRRSFSIRQTRQNGYLLACAALLQGNYALALNTWATLRNK